MNISQREINYKKCNYVEETLKKHCISAALATLHLPLCWWTGGATRIWTQRVTFETLDIIVQIGDKSPEPMTNHKTDPITMTHDHLEMITAMGHDYDFDYEPKVSWKFCVNAVLHSCNAFMSPLRNCNL